MKFFKTLVAVMVANVILFVVVAGSIALVIAGMNARKPDIKDGSTLVVDIYGEVLLYNPPESIPSMVMGGDSETLQRILENLEKAAVDDRIENVVMKVSGNNGLGYAMIEEIREAIDGVQSAGKTVYAFGEYMDRKTMYLASACDSIFLPEVGEVTLTGMGVERSFLKGAFEKLGIRPNIHRIKDYKAAAEPILREDMSAESKAMSGWILDDLWDAQMSAIASGRGMTVDDLEGAMETIMFQASEAKEAGLVDGIAYWSDFEDWLQGDDEEFKSVSQSDYAEVKREHLGLDGDKKIAVIYAHGFIGGRESRVDAALGPMMGHETVAAQFRAAAKDDDVVAVIFRVDSGGGESLTSDMIGREVERTAAKKPVVVSMVDVAASGGYSISYRATKVIADRMTITGSIGSISGKFNTAGMWNKLGVTFDSVTRGPNALMNSSRRDFSDEQRARFEQNHWDGVNDWMRDIAEHRGMTFEKLETLAHGRVWTGRQALDNGLIDEVGGLKRAIEVAKVEAGVPDDEPVTLDNYPHEKGIVGMVTGGNSATSVASWVMYRLIHHDLAKTARLLSEGHLAVWSERIVD